MKTNYRNYQVNINGKALPVFHSVEALSDRFIEISKQNFINEQRAIGRIKEGDKIEFKFKYSHTD